jgi:hypothetical protein
MLNRVWSGERFVIWEPHTGERDGSHAFVAACVAAHMATRGGYLVDIFAPKSTRLDVYRRLRRLVPTAPIATVGLRKDDVGERPARMDAANLRVRGLTSDIEAGRRGADLAIALDTSSMGEASAYRFLAGFRQLLVVGKGSLFDALDMSDREDVDVPLDVALAAVGQT